MKTSTLHSQAPRWFLVDAEGKILGRLAARVAHVLRGKHLPTFSPHQVCGEHVVVINAAKIAVRPSNMRRKVYYRHTGYTGHLKKTTLGGMLEKDPTNVIVLAVRGMLPKNRLREQMMKRLHIFSGSEHPHAAQSPQSLPAHL